VHFVTESLDLHSRGGRLSADIQAVVASDYIRNLREETRKGFYGRLKQGLYPLGAPLGYLDQGKGKAKTIDPARGPLVRRAFELYATAQYNLDTLGAELYRLGLRNRSGTRLSRSALSVILNNPFYIGVIRLRRTSETFAGVHEPLITKPLFDRAQAVLTGKANARTRCHDFLFRRMLSCARCQYSLIGERQKGHVYYRCHSKPCRGTSIREEMVETEVAKLIQRLHFTDQEMAYFQARIVKLRESWTSHKDDALRSLNLRLDQIRDRLNRLTDAYLDGVLDRAMFEQRKEGLLHEQKTVEESLAIFTREDHSTPDNLEKFLELAGNAWLSYELASAEEKREMLNIFTSNRSVDGKNLDLQPSLPFREIANRLENDRCAPNRATPRTLDRILESLAKLNAAGQLPDLSAVAGSSAKH
jgi:site-specific DNA recombinase